MSLNSISPSIQAKQIQALSELNGNNSSQNTNSSFAMALEEMMKNISANNSANSSNSIPGSITNSSSNNAVSGLDSLSLQPQKALQMLQMLSLQNQSSDSSSLNIGSIPDDDNSDDMSMDNNLEGNGDMSQMMDVILQSMMENQSNITNTDSQAYGNLNLSNTLNISGTNNNL